MGEELNTIALSKPEPARPGTNDQADDDQPGDTRTRPAALDDAQLPPLDSPEPPLAEVAGARGRRPWVFGAAIVTGVAVAFALWAGSVRADETSRLLTLTSQIDSQVTTTSARSHDLAAVMDMAERVYEHSDGRVADPATRDVLAEAIADARSAVAQRVTDAPPSSVTQARTLLAQATHIESSLDWAAEDLRVAVDMVQRSQGAQRTLDSRDPVADRTILTSHDGS
ncbi:hypothetical protein [Promicromonospora iranensis]|uniref:Uncharacterized protein n=1 Tax=Promicromonospora iranensis TaxID=1105144 RepID=A0ABU2CLK1_9MICO|nr:hypothetical protein [Promicromonospora iranensis]MDR7382215.1 hypothetical protein [Promicromonospora iranensis]